MNHISVAILKDIYIKQQITNWMPSIETYGLQEKSQPMKIKEIMFHIFELEKLGFVQFDRIPCQQQCIPYHPFYRNNCISIWWEEIKITYKGIKFLN
ncbi:hypothetical protein IM538_09295 [Cytobacillus suaedae]|nr:hypothetical protein IM538_09295 [Cytobacillus suaedae]